jgi:hypothetical protein
LPERVKADGNEEACHSQYTTKATEPYGIAEVPRRSRGGEVFDRGFAARSQASPFGGGIHLPVALLKKSFPTKDNEPFNKKPPQRCAFFEKQRRKHHKKQQIV